MQLGCGRQVGGWYRRQVYSGRVITFDLRPENAKGVEDFERALTDIFGEGLDVVVDSSMRNERAHYHHRVRQSGGGRTPCSFRPSRRSLESFTEVTAILAEGLFAGQILPATNDHVGVTLAQSTM